MKKRKIDYIDHIDESDNERSTNERQSVYAMDNLKGINDLGKLLNVEIEEYNDIFNNVNKNVPLPPFVKERKFKLDESIFMRFNRLQISLFTACTHAFLGNSIKPLKKIITFMDEYNINDSILSTNRFSIDISVLNVRTEINNHNFLDLCALFAVKTDNVEFIEELEQFAIKNINRPDKFMHFRSTTDSYGDMSTISKFKCTRQIMLEAIFFGSNKIYKKLSNTKNKNVFVHADEFIPFLSAYLSDNKTMNKLTDNEKLNIISMEPKFISTFPTNMLLKILPSNLSNIFLF